MSSLQSPPTIIAPSILNADFSNIGNECRRIIEAGANWVHIDIMDGHFVPNITFGPALVASIRGCVKRESRPIPYSFDYPGQGVFDCHMMVEKPEQWINVFADAGCDLYCFHYESITARQDPSTIINPRNIIKQIHERNLLAGIAIKPETPVSVLWDCLEASDPLEKPDMVLVMTVEPGFGGQTFQSEQLPKVKELRKKYPKLWIEVDGGLNEKVIDSAADAGANVIVAGSAVFNSHDMKQTIHTLSRSVEQRR